MAKIDYGVDIDMNDNQILNVAIQTVNALPVSGVTGKLIYYTVDNTLRYWNGSSWVVVTSGTIPSASTSTPIVDGTGAAGSSSAYARGDHVHPTDTSREATANKNAANGYAGLDASSKISVSQIPTGNSANTIPLIKGSISAGNVLKYSSDDGGFVAGSISSVLVYKGSCTYATLPSSGQQIGDVWNVTDAHGTTPAGTNYAWDGSAWDPLGGDIDLSNYVTTTSLSTTLASYAKKYVGTITGDGSTKSFTISHGIGSLPTVQIYDSSGVYVIAKITATTSTAVVDFNTAPGSAVTYSVVCVG